jgi:2-phosphoglycerate kinase
VKTRWLRAWSRREPTTGADGEAALAATPSVAGAPAPSKPRSGGVALSTASGARRDEGRQVSASTLQPKIRRERRIIERPRLIKLLDECEARIILLLAPAGYGKTTLARQWAKTLNRSIWITCTPAHRDVAVLAEDLATGIDSLEGNAGTFVRQFLTANGTLSGYRDEWRVLSQRS